MPRNILYAFLAIVLPIALLFGLLGLYRYYDIVGNASGLGMPPLLGLIMGGVSVTAIVAVMAGFIVAVVLGALELVRAIRLLATRAPSGR